ncbi:MAG: glycosyltransferase family 2 protein [bacterium]|nr:glycosyltransferase family 2 protein [bacterium]MDZ4296339.1 glycosyltransferase family 2 protein [Patescibacteria group bacterium]
MIQVPDPLVAIVVLNWNNVRDTRRCLESLRQLTYRHIRIIVVDNGSDAAERQGLTDALRQYPEATLVANRANLGYSGGNNVGIRAALATGAAYILVLNNDTVCDPACIETLVSAAETHPRAGALGPCIYYADDPEKIWFCGGVLQWKDLSRGAVHLQTLPKIGTPHTTEFLTGCALFVRRAALEAVAYKGEATENADISEGHVSRRRNGVTEDATAQSGGAEEGVITTEDAAARSSGKTDEVLSGEPQRGERAADEGGSRRRPTENEDRGVVDYFDERFFLYFEDIDFNMRLRTEGWGTMVVPAAKLWHKVSATSLPALAAPGLLYYHHRNGLLLAALRGPRFMGIYRHLWAAAKIVKQLFKLALGRDMLQSRAILAGIGDFYRGRFGQYRASRITEYESL